MIQIQQQRLTEVGASASTLASMVGVSSGSLSKYLNGGGSFSPEFSRRIDEKLADLEMLKRLADPLPIDWSCVGIVRRCIDDVKDRLLEIHVNVRDPDPKPQAFAVQFRSNGYFFWMRIRNGELRTTMNLLQAHVMTEELADQLVLKLAEEGYKCVKVASKYADLDNLSVNWPSVWGDK